LETFINDIVGQLTLYRRKIKLWQSF